jgi:UDP-N-acetylglucosamine diphosphorylase/glucosamine-1-phosphate N-acetyltransferase
MHVIVFDNDTHEHLLPLTYTRPTCEIRVGIDTLREKWEAFLQQPVESFLTEAYLQEKYPFRCAAENLFINGAVVPTEELVAVVKKLETGQGLIAGKTLIAAVLPQEEAEAQNVEVRNLASVVEWQQEIVKIERPWDIFRHNGQVLTEDFARLTKGRKSAPLSDSNKVVGTQPVFLEEGASAECAVFNTTNGPVYIGKEAEVMEGSLVRGPFAMGEHSVLKMGAKIYGPTTLGPHVKVGGEVNNSVVFGFSNKGHDGFLGNSVIGEWCNLGADTNNSNLKNNYAEVRLWGYQEQSFVKTGLQFCGLIMGDHSKCGINTMFNTGTVIGVNANIYGEGFPRNFVPSFSWGGASGYSEFSLKKAFEVAAKVMARRQLSFDKKEQDILATVFELSAPYRKF